VAAGAGAVLRRAVEKTVEGRFGSAQLMAEALRGTTAQGQSHTSDATVIAPGTKSLITPVDTERVERALATYLGPIAKVLVKRALPHIGSAAALWDTLAAHIKDGTERAVFLRQRDRSLLPNPMIWPKRAAVARRVCGPSASCFAIYVASHNFFLDAAGPSAYIPDCAVQQFAG
jgi:hypothetical protein